MSDKTTIEVSGETHDRLLLKKDGREPFNAAVERLLDRDIVSFVDHDTDRCYQCGHPLEGELHKPETDYAMWVVPAEAPDVEPPGVQLFCNERCLKDYKSHLLGEGEEQPALSD